MSDLPPRGENRQNQNIRDLMASGVPEMDAIREQLTQKQFLACQTYIQGGSLVECLKSAMSKEKYALMNKKGRLERDLKMDRVFNYLQRRYIALAKEKIEKDSLLSATERRAYLASVVRTPIGDIGPESPLAQTCETRPLKGGGEAVRIAMPDKLTAIRLDAELSGDLDNKKADQQINIALMLGRLPDTSGVPSADPAPSAVVARRVVSVTELPEEPAPGVKRRGRPRKPCLIDREEP